MDILSPTLSTHLAELVAELEQRAPYASALFTSASGTRASIDNREQSANPQDPSQGIVFTLFTGDHFEEWATSDLDPDRLASGLRAWASAVPISSRERTPAGILPAEQRAQTETLQTFVTPFQIHPASLPLPEKLERLRHLQNRARSLHRRIVNVELSYSDHQEQKLFLGGGQHMQQEIIRTLLGLTIIVSDGQAMQYNWLTHAGTGGLELAEVSETELAEVCETALRLLEADSIEPGFYDVVTDPMVSGTIAHECFGHGVELDLFPKGRARSAAYFDQRVAAPAVDMYDDPTVPGAYATYFFDDEGQP